MMYVMVQKYSGSIICSYTELRNDVGYIMNIVILSFLSYNLKDVCYVTRIFRFYHIYVKEFK